MNPQKRAAIDDALEAYIAARERVALLTALANRRTADPGRVMHDLEEAVEQEKRAAGALESAHRLAGDPVMGSDSDPYLISNHRTPDEAWQEHAEQMGY